MKITLIFAITENNVIGLRNKETNEYCLPWKNHNKADMRFFRNVTNDKVIVMGYNTWLSIGQKPLPNRNNVILTKSHYNSFTDANGKVFIAKTIEDILEVFKDINELVIIGGKTIYEQFLPYADTLHITIRYSEYYDTKKFEPIYFKIDNLEKDFECIQSTKYDDIKIKTWIKKI